MNCVSCPVLFMTVASLESYVSGKVDSRDFDPVKASGELQSNSLRMMMSRSARDVPDIDIDVSPFILRPSMVR